MGKVIDITNRRFGYLLVIRRHGSYRTKTYTNATWNCKCDCGKTISGIRGTFLRDGHTKSCGCKTQDLKRESRGTHGDSNYRKKTRLLRIHNHIKQRCYNPKNCKFHIYGGKGVSVCKEWHDYVKFKQWALANGYQEHLTIDRKDSDGDYTPENSQWITLAENSRKGAISRWRKYHANQKAS